jgi:hypothetical protein
MDPELPFSAALVRAIFALCVSAQGAPGTEIPRSQLGDGIDDGVRERNEGGHHDLAPA